MKIECEVKKFFFLILRVSGKCTFKKTVKNNQDSKELGCSYEAFFLFELMSFNLLKIKARKHIGNLYIRQKKIKKAFNLAMGNTTPKVKNNDFCSLLEKPGHLNLQFLEY